MKSRELAHENSKLRWWHLSEPTPDGMVAMWAIDLSPLKHDVLATEIDIPTTWQSAPCTGS